ncbi:IS1182 family transposase [Carnobacterium divergens]|uniref:IS1182 family transposase n=3 Tax=Carnobacterium divergens TaxID=2748 RepID=UPI0039C9B67C
MFKNYTTNQVILPLDFSFQLEKNDIAFAIDQLIESIPEERFLPFNHQMGPSSYHPKMMMKMILCAYTQSVFSGRKIEALTKDSIRMMWLTQSYQPSYRTINRFRVNPLVNALLRECFVQFRSQLVKEQLIDEEAIFIYGTKIEANANKYTFVWKKSIENFDKKLTEKSNVLYDELLKDKIIPEIERESAKELSVTELGQIEEKLAHVVEKFTEKIEYEKDGTIRKSIRSKRKVPKKTRKLVHDFKERKCAYQKHRQILGQRNSYSRTDPDATFMRMKDDHMKNGQLKAAYNLQIATNSQYILGYDLFSNPTDTRTLRPFLTTLKECFFELPNYIVADAGYGGEENYQAVLEDYERTPLITYAMYYKEQKKKFKQNPFLPANWSYQELDDTFICPNGRKMNFRNYSICTDKYGFKRYLKRYECEDCSDCPVRSQCTKAKSDKNREIQKNMNWEYFKATIQQLLSEKETGKIYRQRKIDVEPAFGYLKACLGFTRFSVRGKQQAHNEIGFALMAVNLRKYRLNKPENKGDSPNNRKNRRLKILFAIFGLLFYLS